MALVTDLQAKVLDPAVSVRTLLLMAKTIAVKLKIPSALEWVDFELKGYPEKDSPTPEYRTVRGQIQALNPVRGWVPACTADDELLEILTKRKIGQKISELEDLVSSDCDHVTIDVPTNVSWPLGVDLMRVLIGKCSLVGIVDSVRSRILEWSLELEQKCVVGEGMVFTAEERNIVAKSHFTFMGPISGIQIGDQNVQNNTLHTLAQSLRTLDTTSLPESEQESIREAADTVEKANGKGLRKIFELLGKISTSALGSAVGRALYEILDKHHHLLP
jgi:AbiTii